MRGAAEWQSEWGHSGREIARCLSKCQNGIQMCCTLALSHRVSHGFSTHTQTHADTHHRQVRTINAESNPIRDRVRLVESSWEIKTETTETTGEAVNYWARGLLRHNRVHSYVCVLALTHSCSVHITSIHTGNNKISLLENEMCCIFMAGAPCMLTAWGEEQNQLSLHAPTIFLSFLALLDAKIRACLENVWKAHRGWRVGEEGGGTRSSDWQQSVWATWSDATCRVVRGSSRKKKIFEELLYKVLRCEWTSTERRKDETWLPLPSTTRLNLAWYHTCDSYVKDDPPQVLCH